MPAHFIGSAFGDGAGSYQTFVADGVEKLINPALTISSPLSAEYRDFLGRDSQGRQRNMSQFYLSDFPNGLPITNNQFHFETGQSAQYSFSADGGNEITPDGGILALFVTIDGTISPDGQQITINYRADHVSSGGGQAPRFLDRTFRETRTFLVDRPDAAVKLGGQPDSALRGVGVIQPAPAGVQVLSQDIAPGAAGDFILRVTNTNAEPRRFRYRMAVENASGIEVLALAQFDPARNTFDTLTTIDFPQAGQQTIPQTDLIPAGAGRDFRIRITMRSNALPGDQPAVVFQTLREDRGRGEIPFNNGVFLTHFTAVDSIRVGTAPTPAVPDLHVKKTNEGANLFQGDNRLEPVAGDLQTVRGVSVDGRKVSYDIRVQNDGTEAQRFLLKDAFPIPAGNGVTLDYFLDTRRITAEMNGAGFLTPAVIPPGQSITIRAEVSFTNAVDPGFELETRVNVLNTTGDTNVVRDQVRMLTTFGLVVNTIDDRRDANLLGDNVLDVAPEEPGDQVSLRSAIEAANAGLSGGQIRFNIPTQNNARPVIRVGAANGGALPALTKSLVAIVGQTQPGARQVEIDGAQAGANADGLTIDANATRVEGLFVHGFSGDGVVVKKSGNFIGGVRELAERNVFSGNGRAGVRLEASANLVRNNRIGTTPDGAAALANATGVSDFAGGNTIGAVDAANLISGNTGNGVFVRGTVPSTVIAHNRIGTNAAGTAAVRNRMEGILVREARNALIEHNLLSGNGDDGIEVFDTALDTRIFDNLIGFTADGEAPLPNRDGIVDSGDRTQIGLRDAATGKVSRGNRIGNSQDVGVNLSGENTTLVGNIITRSGSGGVVIVNVQGAILQGNFIGTDRTGANLGNAGQGVAFHTGAGVVIGGVASRQPLTTNLPVGPGNTIAFNGGGIQADPRPFVGSGRMPAILTNLVFANGGQGIKNERADEPPPPPVIISAETSAKSTFLVAEVRTTDSGPNRTVLVQFFADDPASSPNQPQARRFLGSFLAVNVPGNSTRQFAVALPTSVPGRQVITATATYVTTPGGQAETSRFSAAVEPRTGVDFDDDGIIDQAEFDLDANEDGILDSTQSHVAPLQTGQVGTGAPVFALVSTPATPLKNVSHTPLLDAALDLPPGVTPATGVVNFQVQTDTAGRAQVRVKFPRGVANRYIKLDLDPDSPQGYKVRRTPEGKVAFFDFDEANQLGTIVTADEVSGEVVLFLMYLDGFPGDDDSVAGIVSDPGIFVFVPETDVKVTVAGPPRGNIATNQTFTVAVKNEKAQLADDVRVKVTIPAGFDFVSGGTFDAVTRTVTIAVGDVAGNTTVQQALVLKPKARGTHQLTAAVALTGIALDTNAANDAATATTVIAAALPTITASVKNRKLLVVGTTLPDKVRLTLQGSQITVTPLSGSLLNSQRTAAVFANVAQIEVRTQQGNDTIELVGSGFTGPIKLFGGAGNDLYRLGARGARVRVIDTAGQNSIGFVLATQGVRLDLRQVAGQVQAIDRVGNTVAMTGVFVKATGSRYDDVIIGQQGMHTLVGGGGNDRLAMIPVATTAASAEPVDQLFELPDPLGLFSKYGKWLSWLGRRG